ncbi:MAG TPA: hypothetical protein VLJ11_10110 [Bryobacteraceae bacterium]|nr:hypothetical protein [Bryobacteraceae bacterium]
MWISIPNPRSTNPFPSNAVPGGPEYYTVTVSRSAPTGDEANFLQLGDTQLAWIIYRIYVPNKGLERNAGVPLPTITLIGYDGKSQTVPSCHSSRNSDVLSKFIRELTNPHLGADGAFLGARMRPEEFSTIE